MKKLVSLFLTLVLSLGLCVPALAADFSDVPADHWAYSAIQTAAEKGITSGYSDGTFKPSAPVTNIQFLVMLSRAFYAEDVAQWAADAAASKNDWWWPNWYAMTRRHILRGNELFENRTLLGERGNLGITRQDMAWLLADVLSEKGGSAMEEQKAEAQAQIADYASIPAGYQEAVKTAFALGLITGYSDGTFGGDKTMNRAQGCIVIDRLAQYVGGGSGTGPAVPADDDLTEVPNSPGNTPAGQEASANAENGTPTLRDGSAPTEENALKIIQETLKVYPNGAIWGDRDNGGIRNNSTKIGGRELGGISSAVMKISNTYSASMQSGCGGFASLVSDAIFGGSTNGGNNFPIRKLTSVSQVRPGDILVQLDSNDHAVHILTAASRITRTDTSDGVTAYRVGVYDGNCNGKVRYNTNFRYITDDLLRGSYYEAWTRYPD